MAVAETSTRNAAYSECSVSLNHFPLVSEVVVRKDHCRINNSLHISTDWSAFPTLFHSFQELSADSDELNHIQN